MPLSRDDLGRIVHDQRRQNSIYRGKKGICEPDSYDSISEENKESCRKIGEVVAAAVVPKWIPVSERLPDQSDYYLVFSPGRFMCGDDFIEYVTHWMPLPDPPQDSKDENHA